MPILCVKRLKSILIVGFAGSGVPQGLIAFALRNDSDSAGIKNPTLSHIFPAVPHRTAFFHGSAAETPRLMLRPGSARPAPRVGATAGRPGSARLGPAWSLEGSEPAGETGGGRGLRRRPGGRPAGGWVRVVPGGYQVGTHALDAPLGRRSPSVRAVGFFPLDNSPGF